MRDHFTKTGLQHYLDTPAGAALIAQHGSRQAAAAAVYQMEEGDRAWRRAVAEERFERYPERFESPGHAMASIPDPFGGGGAWIGGDSDDVIRALRSADPAAPFRNLGEQQPMPAGTPYVAMQRADGSFAEVDTRPPWQRED